MQAVLIIKNKDPNPDIEDTMRTPVLNATRKSRKSLISDKVTIAFLDFQLPQRISDLHSQTHLYIGILEKRKSHYSLKLYPRFNFRTYIYEYIVSLFFVIFLLMNR